MSATTMTLAGPGLYRDTRGAVMITGLFMSTMLIGSLWFVMGVGDAIVFRDKMQEAVDHGVFAASILHAKGMNLIALLNIIMLIAVIVHIGLGIISDIKFAKAVACLGKWGPLIIPCLLIRVPQWWSAYDRWDDYFDKMAPALRKIHTAQKIASYVYPALGVANAYTTGDEYNPDRRTGKNHGGKVIALSTSLIPGGGINGSERPQTNGQIIGKVPGRNPRSWKGNDPSKIQISTTTTPASSNNGSGKEGLPVQAKEFGELCSLGPRLGVGSLFSLFGAGGGGGWIGKIIGWGVKFRYCNKIHINFPPLGPGFHRFWGEDGPYVVYKPAKNGNMWFQTWGLNVNPKYDDTSESRVAIAKSRQALIPAKYTEEQKAIYFAQSEFYFDCDDTWDKFVCNADEHAMFSIKWRARLVRVDIGTILSGVVGGALEALTNLSSYQQFRTAGIGAVVTGITSRLGGGLFTRAMLTNFLGELVSQAESWVKDQVTGGIGRTPTIGGIYH